MADEHPNIAVLKRFDPASPAGWPEVMAENVVFRFFNPNLPDMQGDYIGLDGVRQFFTTIMEKTKGTFRVNPQSATPVGDELVVVHTINSMTLPDMPGQPDLSGQEVAVDVVVVWRIVNGRVRDAWDIPSAYTLHTPGHTRGP